VNRAIHIVLINQILLLVLSANFSVFAQVNVTGQWSKVSYTMPINPIHATLLRNGKILLVAGSGSCPPSQAGCPLGAPYSAANGSGALVLDPITGSKTQFSLSWDMFCNSMVALPDGRILINGGTIHYDPFYGAKTNAVFDPANSTFTNVQNMAHGRWYPTATVLGDGRVMTFSGLNETGGTNTAVEIYTPGTGWSTQHIASWTPPLYPRMHLLPNGKVFYSGSGTLSRVFDLATFTWANSATTIYGGTRTYGSSVLLPLTPANGYRPKVMILGGNSPATGTTEIIDLGAATPQWTSGPSMSQPRIEMNAVLLPNGKVLAIGGSTNDEDTSSLSLNADLLNPVAKTRTSAGANTTQRLYHSVALLLPNATVWLAGGNPQRGNYNNTVEIYKPAYLFNSTGGLTTRPTITSAPASVSWGNSFTVQTSDAATISSVVLIRPGSPTHAFDQEQRLVGLSFAAGSGVLNVTAPPNGNIAPPGYYMLFLLNSSGVPSVAKFVQIVARPDFAISATPSSKSVVQGTGTTYTLTVSALNGFAGTVNLAVSGLPSAASSSFNPVSITTSGSSTVTITTSTATPSGSYPLTITATSGALTHTAKVTLVVTADFTLSATPTSHTISRGSSTDYAVTVASTGTFKGTVSFSVTGLPKHASASFTPSTLTGTGSSSLKITTNKSVTSGTYTLKITGTSGTVSHSTNVSLTIQ
jgi:hypothetical protein